MLLWVVMWKIWGASFVFLWMKITLNAMKEREPIREKGMCLGWCEELVCLRVVLSWEGSWERGVWELWRVG